MILPLGSLSQSGSESSEPEYVPDGAGNLFLGYFSQDSYHSYNEIDEQPLLHLERPAPDDTL